MMTKVLKKPSERAGEGVAVATARAERSARKAAQTWLQAKEAKEEADAAMKAAAAQLESYCAAHPAFFEDSNTHEIGGVKCVITNESKVKETKFFDPIAFANDYPECVEIKAKVSAVKGLMVKESVRDEFRRLGLRLETEQKFGVKRA